MNFNAETPRAEALMGGVTVTVPQPFVVGHVCTEGEASSLNQTLVENTRNNLVGRTKKELKDGETAFVITQEAVDEYVSDYEFGVRKAGGGEARLPPEQREARKIARERITAALNKKGTALKSVTAEIWEKLIAQALERHPEIMKEAQRRVNTAAKIGIDELDLGDLTTGAGEEAAAA